MRILLPVLLTLSPLPAECADADTHSQLSALRSEIQALEINLERSKNNHSELVEQLKLIDIHISKLTLLINRTDANIISQERKLRALKLKKEQLTTQIKQYRRELAQQLRSSHALGQRDYLKILLNSQEPGKLSRMLTYLDFLSRNQLQIIQQAKRSYQALQQTEIHIDSRRKSLDDDRSRQRKDLLKLNQSKQQRAQVVASLGQQITTKQKKLQLLRANQARLKQLLHEVSKSRAARRPKDVLPVQSQKQLSISFRKLKGKLPRPTSARVIRKFGQSQTGGLASNGIIFATPVGQQVTAVAAGRVIYSDWLRGFGMLLIIDHGKQYMSLYGQNTSLHKTTGDWVESEEVIANAGDSDGLQESGLYFELRYEGKPINPNEWLIH
ncbi:MAG: murein hydrolase activator EnvC [Thiohalomonadales bacterium]